MSIEVAHVETPVDGTLELGPALPAHLVEVGVVPQVGCRPREAAITVEQGRGLGDRSPAVQIVLRVEREAHADVFSPVLCRGFSCPGCRHHQGGCRGRAIAQRLVDGDIPGVEHSEIGAAEHEHAVVRAITELFNQCRHRIDGSRSEQGCQPLPTSVCTVTARGAPPAHGEEERGTLTRWCYQEFWPRATS